jgi:hypothetical protein
MFGRVVILVEGATESACLPIYADALAMNMDSLGVSIVNARGKDSLESLYHLYSGFGFPVYVIFDNDVGKRSGGPKDQERRKISNQRLTRLLGIAESDAPDPDIAPTYAIMDGDFERTLHGEIDTLSEGLFARLTGQAGELYGTGSKPIAARYIADYLIMVDFVPPTVRHLMRHIAVMAGRPAAAKDPDDPLPKSASGLVDDLPF